MKAQENFTTMEQKYGAIGLNGDPFNAAPSHSFGAISKTLEEMKTGLLKELSEGVKVLSERYKKE